MSPRRTADDGSVGRALHLVLVPTAVGPGAEAPSEVRRTGDRGRAEGVGSSGDNFSSGLWGSRQVARLVAFGQIRSIRTAVVVAALAGPVAVRGRGFGEAGCRPTRAG